MSATVIVVCLAKMTDDSIIFQANVCGVSIIRSGEAMEAALRSCWKGIDIGKILVHRRHAHTPKATSANLDNTTSSHSSPEKSSTVSAQASPIARDINGNYYRHNQCASLLELGERVLTYQ